MQEHNRRFSAILIEKLILHEKSVRERNRKLSTFCRVNFILEFSLKRVSILHAFSFQAI